jgi:hypothetical protein
MPEQKCTLTGFIGGTGDAGLDGKLVVTLDGPLVIEATTPDRYLVGVPVTFTVTAGALSGISLYETETKGTSYHFQFFRLVSVSVYADNPIIDFHAVIPDAATYEWSQLAPSGISVDRLATGALRVGRAILIDPLLNTPLKKVLGIYRQATPPVATADGDVWVQSTTGMIFTWAEAVSQWLSEPFFTVAQLTGQTSTIEQVRAIPTLLNFGGTDAGVGGSGGTLFLTQTDLRWNVTSPPQDTNNRWGIYALA